MARAERVRDPPGIVELVESGAIEAHREGRQLVDVRPCERGDRRGVEAAREEEPERDVAHERDLHGARELDPELRRRRRQIDVERRRAHQDAASQ